MNAYQAIHDAVQRRGTMSARDVATYATLGWIESIARAPADTRPAEDTLAEIREALDARDRVLVEHR